MTHADRIRAAEKDVIVCAVSFHERGTSVSERDLLKATAKLLAVRAETCLTCGGSGEMFGGYDGFGEPVNVPCPAGCDQGRRRDA